MNSRSALATSADCQRLETLARCVRFLSCGKLKRASQLISEADNPNPQSTDSDDMQEMILECKRLGLIVQSRKFLHKADVLLISGEYESAYRKYTMIGIAGLPRDISFQVHHNQAVCLMRLSRYGEAIEHFHEALLRFPKSSYAMQNLAFALITNKEYREALQILSELIRQDDVQPGSLLHILYGSAECRQQLNLTEHSTDIADNTLQMIQQHQTQMRLQAECFSDANEEDNESYNDYGMGFNFQESFQNVAHVRYNETSAPVPMSMTSLSKPALHASALPTHVPFRRLRYQESTVPEEEPRGKLFIETALDKPDTCKEEAEQSPVLSVRSKQKRDTLRTAIGAFDRSVLVKSPLQQGQVRATFPTLNHRARATDPSPGVFARVEPTLLRTEKASGVEDDHNDPERTHNVSSSLSVSSAKPNLSAHHRNAAHFDFPPPSPSPPPLPQPAVPVHFPVVPKLPPKLDIAVINAASQPPIQTETEEFHSRNSSTADAKVVLAPAVPITAPKFLASPLPGPRGRSQAKRIAASSAKPNITPPPQSVHAPDQQLYAEGVSASVSSSSAASNLPDDLDHNTSLHVALTSSSNGVMESVEKGSSARAIENSRAAFTVSDPLPLAQHQLNGSLLDSASPPSMSTDTQGSHKPRRPSRVPDSAAILGMTAPASRDNTLIVVPHVHPAAASLASTPVTAPADLSSVNSVPPASIHGSVEASHKPRRPSIVPDLDKSPSLPLPTVVADRTPPALSAVREPIKESAPQGAFIPHDHVTLSILSRDSREVSAPSNNLYQDQLKSAAVPQQHTAPLAQPLWSTHLQPLTLPSQSIQSASVSGSSTRAHSRENSSGPVRSPSTATVMSGISAESTSLATSGHISTTFRFVGAHTVIPASEASEQQQEMDRVFEGRRYVDNYTITNADVMKLRSEFQTRFPASSGLPTVSYPYSALRSPGPYPPDVDIRIREMYLSEAEFQYLFHTSKSNWLSLPEWRQRSMKKELGLF